MGAPPPWYTGWCRGAEYHAFTEPGWNWNELKTDPSYRTAGGGFVACHAPGVTATSYHAQFSQGEHLVGDVGSQIIKTAIALTPVAASLVLPAAAAPTLAFIAASRAIPTKLEEQPMAIGGAFNPLLQLAGAVGGAYLGGSTGQIVSSLSQQFLAPPQVQQIAAPVYGAGGGYGGGPVATPVQLPALSGAAGSIIMQEIKAILFKVAQALGLRSIPSLSRAIGMIRAAAKVLAPAAIGAALGITTEELAKLIVVHQRRKRRRMNPCNAKALRRGLRRIRSFQRLSAKVHLVGRTRGRSRKMAYCPPGQPMIVQN